MAAWEKYELEIVDGSAAKLQAKEIGFYHILL